MKLSNKAIAMATLIAIASPAATAEDTRGFYFGAGAGYMPAGELNLQPVPAAGESLAAFVGFRLNSQIGVEGFYADINPMALLSERSSNLYTQSYLGNGLADDAVSSVAGVSVVTTLTSWGPVRPFARAGLHQYNFEGGSGQLLLGGGATIDLSRGWNARLEWERYRDVDRMDLDIFSASFEYKF